MTKTRDIKELGDKTFVCKAASIAFRRKSE
jgi:hypothetical protein